MKQITIKNGNILVNGGIVAMLGNSSAGKPVKAEWQGNDIIVTTDRGMLMKLPNGKGPASINKM